MNNPPPKVSPASPRGPIRPPLRTPGDLKPAGRATDGFSRRRVRRNGPARRVLVKRIQQRLRSSLLPGQTAEQSAAWFVDQLKHRYPDLSRAEKTRLEILVHRTLPPLPAPKGRPPRSDVTQALQLEREGISRREIYCRLGKATRDEQHALREAMRQRKSRSRKRDNSTPVTPTNSV